MPIYTDYATLERLPIFVYGALLTSERDSIFRNRNAIAWRATLSGYRMFVTASGAPLGGFLPFPFIARTRGESIVGELITACDGEYAKVLQMADTAEGALSHRANRNFSREIREVTASNGVVHRAYVHIPTHDALEWSKRGAGRVYVPGGDWKAYKQTHENALATGWRFAR